MTVMWKENVVASEWANRPVEQLELRHSYATEADLFADADEAERHDWHLRQYSSNDFTGLIDAEFLRGRPMARPNPPGAPAHDVG